MLNFFATYLKNSKISFLQYTQDQELNICAKLGQQTQVRDDDDVPHLGPVQLLVVEAAAVSSFKNNLLCSPLDSGVFSKLVVIQLQIDP